MESYSIEEARRRLGDIHAAVVHGRGRPRIIDDGRDPVVLVTEQEWRELQQLRREREVRRADRDAARIKQYLDAGQVPPGYEVYTCEQVVAGEWLT